MINFKDYACIYVLFHPIMKVTKVGISSNVLIRKAELEVGAACRLTLIYNTLPMLNVYDYERKIHNILKDKNTFGEWFSEDYNVIVNIVKETCRDVVFCHAATEYVKGVKTKDIAQYYNVSRQAIERYIKCWNINNQPDIDIKIEKNKLYEAVVKNEEKLKKTTHIQQHTSTISKKRLEEMVRLSQEKLKLKKHAT